MTDTGPTERELDVLKVLWELGEARVRDVHEAMNRQEECAFTTVQTLLRIMAKKGLVTQRLEDRTLFFTPVHTREQVSSRFLTRVFDGALSKLVLNMLQAEKVSVDEMRELERLVAKARRQKQKED
ncbi:BlaI/MecI/CopY family transcriptional regulator [Schlesneria paludicola]|uniref:BlaI/MecI/CopY family transcriptional regulator n=1 Tax=Schlesneria paludicola TaxID=360056 RepID=UPI00029A5A0C|nr:BlaI/MecI/CopY family transcriptional regulator [Schlesneria paludicola]